MIKLSKIFTNGCLLQRDQPFKIWGWADCDSLTVTLAGGKFAERKHANPDKNNKNKFEAEFGAISDYVSDYTLTVEGGGEIRAVKLRFGDLYLAIGQSNMSYSLAAIENCDEIKRRAALAQVRFLDLYEKPFTDLAQLTRPYSPLDDFDTDYSWRTGGDDIGGISAIAVAAATCMYEQTRVPTGVIAASMGGLCIETYLPRERVESDPELYEFTRRAGRYQSESEYNKIGARNFTQLSGIYNQKISPLIGLRFSGIAWYLGESSAWDFEFAQMFKKEMQILARHYTSLFGGKFAAVEIAQEYYPYGDRHGYEYINEALASLENDFDNYLYIPIYDIEPRWLKPDGDLYYHPIHPVNKLPVAERLAAAFVSGARSPRITDVKFSGGVATVTVSEAVTGGKGVQGFTLAGKDGKYYPASATASGNKITVTCASVNKPCELTYGFTLYRQNLTLKSKSGLPLIAYRTNCQSVHSGYCFTPAYLNLYDNVCYENCFGYTVGTCRKVTVWHGGDIYCSRTVKVKVKDGVLTASATPANDDYYIFGYSPTICLSGHKTHLNGYKYLNFKLKAKCDTQVTFMGVVVRAACGEVFRYDILNGEERAPSLAVDRNYRDYTVDLTRGVRGDEAEIEFSDELSSSFVQMEFIFRALSPAEVNMRDINLSNVNTSEKFTVKTESENLRADVQLPE